MNTSQPTAAEDANAFLRLLAAKPWLANLIVLVAGASLVGATLVPLAKLFVAYADLVSLPAGFPIPRPVIMGLLASLVFIVPLLAFDFATRWLKRNVEPRILALRSEAA